MSGDDLDGPALVDFSRALLSWTTIDGSQGHWQVIASATNLSAQGGERERYFLGPLVMAGDVYGEGRLPREPAYSFQLIASADRHAIIRDYPDDPQGKDTAARNLELFSALAIHAPPLRTKRLTPAQMAVADITQRWPLTARVGIDAGGGECWLLDFPVRHANTKSGEGVAKFQIETGPVLIPGSVLNGALATVAGNFALAYVFFNRLDRIDLSLFGPTRSGRTRGYSVPARISPVEIALYYEV